MNLPCVAVHDLKIKNADLVIATHGRSFWILDDISPLRQSHLFTPEPFTRFGYTFWQDYGGGPESDKKYYFVCNGGAPLTFCERSFVDGERKREYINAGGARPEGVMLYYLLSDKAEDVTLEILDAEGEVIRRFGEEEITTERFPMVQAREWEYERPVGASRAGVEAGLNRFIWNMRYPGVSSVPGKPDTVIQPLAAPGRYQVRLTVDERSQTQPFEIRLHPGERYTRAETDEKFAFWMTLRDEAERAVQTVLKAQQMKEDVAQLVADARGRITDAASKPSNRWKSAGPPLNRGFTS